MAKNSYEARGPFWKDDPSPTGEMGKEQFRFFRFSSILFAIFITICAYAWIFLIAYELDFSIGGWLFVILLVVGSPLLMLFRARKFKDNIERAKTIRREAKKQTQADIIGSAIHVAGHPLLLRDQQVVLALKGDVLSVFNYDEPKPIFSFNVDDIVSMNTVTYDEDRVAHIEVIDSAAQALQMTFSIGNEEYSCLFRRMLPIRPIDWYHNLQTARFTQTGN